MAETPNATEPTRLRKVIRTKTGHRVATRRGPSSHSPSATRANFRDQEADRSLKASGLQTGWCAPDAPSPTTRALKVVRLNQRVPTNCTFERCPPRRCGLCLHREELPETTRLGPVKKRIRGCCFEILKEGGGREEDGADEVGEVVWVRPYAVREAGERAKRETGGTDGKQDTDPPGDCMGAHHVDPVPLRSNVLAMPARFPNQPGSVSPDQLLAGDEWAKPARAATA